MAHPLLAPRQFTCLALGLMFALGTCAQDTWALRRVTLEAIGSAGRLSAGLPDAEALLLRGTWDYEGGNVLRLEALKENKFASQGGISGIGFVKVLSPDWSMAANLTLGRGGVNWASSRVDVEAAAKWGETRNIVTRAGLYHARFEGDRSDRGLQLALVDYLSDALVLEAGILLNISEPGAVHSHMPFISATVGRNGQQYLSFRLSSGSEAYQAVDVNRHVAKVRPHVLVDEREAQALQLLADFHHRRHMPAQAQQFAAQAMDALDVARAERLAEDALLQFFDLGMDLLGQRPVVLDDEAEQGIEHEVLAVG